MAEKEGPQRVMVDITGVALGVFLGLVMFALVGGAAAALMHDWGWW